LACQLAFFLEHCVKNYGYLAGKVPKKISFYQTAEVGLNPQCYTRFGSVPCQNSKLQAKVAQTTLRQLPFSSHPPQIFQVSTPHCGSPGTAGAQGAAVRFSREPPCSIALLIGRSVERKHLPLLREYVLLCPVFRKSQGKSPEKSYFPVKSGSYDVFFAP